MLTDVLYNGHSTEALVLSDAARHQYWKELIYTGHFAKLRTDGSFQEFDIDLLKLQHFANTFSEFANDGIAVPTPIAHTEDPEKSRGKIVAMKVQKNKKGLDSLYGLVQFNDENSAKQLSNSNVSIYVPKQFVSDKKKVYVSPIRHVAFTDYPVVSGLEAFELVASFTENGSNKMDKIAAALGVDPKAEDIEAAIVAAIDALKAKIKAPEPTPKPDEEKKLSNPPDMNLKLSQTMASITAKSIIGGRNAVIDGLVGTKLTPAAAKELKTAFCNDESLALSLSTNGTINDDAAFNSVILSYKSNADVLKLGEKSGPQVPDLELSGADLVDAKKNPLIAACARR